MGISGFTFIGLLQIIFFIIFVLLNIGLLYLEYLDRKHTNKDNSESYLKSGMSPELQKIAKHFIVSVVILSSVITVKNEIKDQQKEAALRAEAEAALAKAVEEAKRISKEKGVENFYHRLHGYSIKNSFDKLKRNQEEQSELIKAIKERNVQWGKDGDRTHIDKNKIDSVKIEGLKVEAERTMSELGADINKASKFNEAINKETDESTILAIVNDDIKKSSIFGFDLEELWTLFESLNGITKIVVTMMLSSYLILTSIIGLGANLYGDYLLDRFNLEEKYPKIAIFIKYRKKLSKYYILSNILFIILTCLSNIIFGLVILYIIYI